jgi:hypothetical protein
MAPTWLRQWVPEHANIGGGLGAPKSEGVSGCGAMGKRSRAAADGARGAWGVVDAGFGEGLGP